METLSTHLTILVLEAAFGEDDTLGKEGLICQRVNMFLEQLVYQNKLTNGLLRLCVCLDGYFNCVLEHM